MDVIKDRSTMTPLVTTANHRISTPNRQSDLVSLSFKVPLNFRVRFKLHATQRGISMNELLRQAFDRVMQEQELPTARSEDS